MAETMLSGMKILDLTWQITGPACTKLLADYGADIIKIERPRDGDPARRIGPFLNDEPHPDKSLLFSYLNLNKRGVTLDLKAAEGKKIFLQLVKEADILVESFSPGVMARLGLDYATLKAVNPSLLMAAISNFGQDGPYRDFKASELVMTGLSKDQYSHGHDGREPLKWGGNVLQYQAGYLASIGILAGYWMGINGGTGQYIDCSIHQMMSTDNDNKRPSMQSWSTSGRGVVRRDTRSTVASILRAGMYPCKDGYITISCGPALWGRFLKLMQSPELEALKVPEAFYDMDNLPLMDAIWANWCLDRTKQEVMEQCQAQKIWCGAVNTPMDALQDPHFNSRGFWVEVEHPVSGKQIYPGAPIDIPDAPWAARRPAPLLGQHNEEVYCGQLGYTVPELVNMKEARIV